MRILIVMAVVGMACGLAGCSSKKAEYPTATSEAPTQKAVGTSGPNFPAGPPGEKKD